jgi:hypothetical protein
MASRRAFDPPEKPQDVCAIRYRQTRAQFDAKKKVSPAKQKNQTV